MGLEGSSSTVLSPDPSASVGCGQQPSLQSVVAPCPRFSRGNTRDSLHSTNPAFRLASPSPSLSRAGFVLEDAPEVSFVPLPWGRPKTDAGLVLFLNTPLHHRQKTPHTGRLQCVLPFEIQKCYSRVIGTLPVSLLLHRCVFTQRVSFKMKVNLSKVWKHKLRIFLDTFLWRRPGHAFTLSQNLKAIRHINGVKLLISKASTSSNLGIFTL